MENRLYLNVPYSEKEEAKKLNARWDSIRKKWYYAGDPKNYVKFSKWLLETKDFYEIEIICDYIYIVEGKKECWKCKKETKVIGLGMEKCIRIFNTEEVDENENLMYDFEEFGFGKEKELYIFWFRNESSFPSDILKYLKENYPVKTGYSKVAGKYFANHCEHCGAIQGNNFVFDEYDSPFSLTEDTLEKNIEKVKNMKFKKIKLKENICTLTNFDYNGEEDFYLEYGSVEEIEI